MIENLNQETESIKRTNENCEMENTISNIKMSLDRINRKIKMTSEIDSKIEGTEKKKSVLINREKKNNFKIQRN